MPPENRPELGEFAAPQWTRTQLCRQLRAFLKAQAARAGTAPRRVGTDVAFYYDPADRLARVTPDLFVLPPPSDGRPDEEILRTFKVWERVRRPELVIHLVEQPVAPEDGLLMHFRRLGVHDVVLYDPLWYLGGATAAGSTGQAAAAAVPPKGRRLLWHYTRVTTETGDTMKLVPLAHPGRVPLARHGLWLIHRGGGDLRLYAGGPERIPDETACWLLPEEREG